MRPLYVNVKNMLGLVCKYTLPLRICSSLSAEKGKSVVCRSDFDLPKIERYMLSYEMRKIHLGCGPVILSGWLNCDYTVGRALEGQIARWNVLEPYPLPDAQIDFFYINHTLEHFTLDQAYAILSEIFRCLKPGGALRVGVPALDKLLRIYLNSQDYDLKGYGFNPAFSGFSGHTIRTMCTFLNEMMRNHGHSFLYDYETLAFLLQTCGFLKVKEESYACSEIPEFKGLEDDEWWLRQPGETPEWRKVCRDSTLYVLAVK